MVQGTESTYTISRRSGSGEALTGSGLAGKSSNSSENILMMKSQENLGNSNSDSKTIHNSPSMPNVSLLTESQPNADPIKNVQELEIKKKSYKFRLNFNLPNDQMLQDEFPCFLNLRKPKISTAGHLMLSQSFICFVSAGANGSSSSSSSNYFVKLVIPAKFIVAIKKEPSGIILASKDISVDLVLGRSYTFSSLKDRDIVYEKLLIIFRSFDFNANEQFPLVTSPTSSQQNPMQMFVESTNPRGVLGEIIKVPLRVQFNQK